MVPELVELSFMTKLFVPVIPPLKIGLTAPLVLIVRVPTEALVASTIGLVIVRVLASVKVAAKDPLVSPNVTFPGEAPTDAAFVEAETVPDLIVSPPL